MCFLPLDNHYFGLRSQPQQAACMCSHQQCVSERAFHEQCVWPRSAAMCNYFFQTSFMAGTTSRKCLLAQESIDV